MRGADEQSANILPMISPEQRGDVLIRRRRSVNGGLYSDSTETH